MYTFWHHQQNKACKSISMWGQHTQCNYFGCIFVYNDRKLATQRKYKNGKMRFCGFSSTITFYLGASRTSLFHFTATCGSQAEGELLHLQFFPTIDAHRLKTLRTESVTSLLISMSEHNIILHINVKLSSIKPVGSRLFLRSVRTGQSFTSALKFWCATRVTLNLKVWDMHYS